MQALHDQRGLASNIALAIIAVVALLSAGTVTYISYNTQQQAKLQQDELIASPVFKPTPKKPENIPPPPESSQRTQLTVALAAQNNSDESGTAVLTEVDGHVQVMMKVDGEPAGAKQPAHIHTGACPTPGAVVYPLNNVVGGNSTTVLDVSMETLLAQLPLAINIHKSATELKSYMSCGDIINNSASVSAGTEGGILGALNAKAEDQARMEARDAKRVADMKQLAQAFIIADAQNPGQKIPCGSGKATIMNNSNCTGSLGTIIKGTVTDWNYWNTVNTQSSSENVGCHSSSTASCATTIKANAKTNNFEVCFYLETQNSYGPAGVYHIGTDGLITAGCSIKASSL